MNRSRSRFGLMFWTVALLGLIWVGVGDRLLTHWAYAFERGRIQANSQELDDIEGIASLQAVSRAFRMVAKVARPGVVNITVGAGVPEQPTAADIQRLREQFGDVLTDEQIVKLLLREKPPGSGSGIIFDDDGHILTNNHVVGGRREIKVQLSDDRVCDAHLVGTDPQTDLAIIKISANDLHPLKFGDSQKAEVGDWVVAVGAPFGLSQTVTHGIISATDRTRVEGLPILYQNFIQTDAAINPGNSGGPLLNLRGEVIGVNTAIATNGDYYNAGVAFTIPSKMAVKVARQLIASGRVERGWLGVHMRLEPLTEDAAEILHLPNAQGVLVDGVVIGSPAEEAGLRTEDVIIAVNGEPSPDAEHMRAMIADIGPNEDATVRIIREGHQREIKVQLGLRMIDRDEQRAVNLTRPVGALGVAARSFDPGLSVVFPSARQYDDTERGVFVADISADESAKPKIHAGELIVACEGEPIETVSDLLKALEAVPDNAKVRLQILEPNGDRRIVRVAKRPGS